MPEITCYFSPQSGYAYLGHARLVAIARAHGAAILWRPVDILKVFAEGGSTAPAKQSPVRNAYRKVDIVRWAKRAGISINTEPAFWPTDTLPACRLIAAAMLQGIDATDLIGACLGAVWARNLQISERATLVRLADEVGLDGAHLAELSDSVEAAERVARNTAEAIAAGVFGSPSYVVDGELYFGQDRLDFLAEALAGAPAEAAQ
ncbi:2-hydroxychromene-2-carboxylate isomerase [Xanthobacter dioxanivorans]|uniref:2-hydroxychromene-2-carboxylate isomerase n=1 Tax=Xanthobacter dioxanivorans TaxID=2528964 RepID=A0A974PTP2_9HYPH|nr:2-hydroxychromene-2-carboxylate isomerase [Xanthobacter dioxanivorans]QRG09214.1 2-hydroxychromene-2-carboxylate isomerase [Xanthobacter dioxanivorans]